MLVFYYKGGDSGSSLSLGKDDFNSLQEIPRLNSSAVEEVGANILSGEFNLPPGDTGDAAARAYINDMNDFLPEVQREFEAALE